MALTKDVCEHFIAVALVVMFAELKVSAHMQHRVGPYFAGGRWGWAQVFAEALKFLQEEDLPAPHYKLISESGPDHKKDFVIEVLVNKTSLAKAHGSSRKNAELKAAEAALKSFFGKKIESLTQETFVFKK